MCPQYDPTAGERHGYKWTVYTNALGSHSAASSTSHWAQGETITSMSKALQTHHPGNSPSPAEEVQSTSQPSILYSEWARLHRVVKQRPIVVLPICIYERYSCVDVKLIKRWNKRMTELCVCDSSSPPLPLTPWVLPTRPGTNTEHAFVTKWQDILSADLGYQWAI